jgi:hypothetical protein
MVTMTWNLTTGPDGRRGLRAAWKPVVVPGPRASLEDRPVQESALKAS